MTRPAPPLDDLPAPLALTQTGRLARIARMDRAALRELLAEQGACLDAALRARGVAPSAHDERVIDVVRAVWGGAALLSASAPDERAFVLAHALACAPAPSLEDTDLDARLLTRLCARVASGVASPNERSLLETMREDARVQQAFDVVEAAHAAARSGAAGGGRALTLWASIEPALR